jgi:hypothetical protein
MTRLNLVGALSRARFGVGAPSRAFASRALRALAKVSLRSMRITRLVCAGQGERVGEVIKFPHVRRVRPVESNRPKDAARAKGAGDKPVSNKSIGEGDTLCRAGFHKWIVDQKKQFDVKLGKLVTVRRCDRCGARKTTLD